MLKADQSAIINEANVDMVSLRTSEIQYFSQFFSSFGTQAALISGFIVGNVTQIPGLDSKSHFLWIYLFWITSALAFCSAMHVLICSIFISVYGQGLALRGPTGSMVKAVEGMVVEQDSIVTSFGFTVLFLGLNLIGTCGIMMSFPFAVISSIITTMGMFVWYQACLRIHNRFKFMAPSSDWDPDNDNDDWDPESNSGKVHHYSYGSIGLSAISNTPISTITTNNINHDMKLGASISNNSNINVNVNQARMEGYLETVDYIFSSSSSSFLDRSKKWTRKYFVLKNGHVFYYIDKDSSYYQAEHPLNKRPISFSGYFLQEEIITTTDNHSLFTLILTPKADDVDFERVWKFRCDNYEELTKWKNALIADGLVHLQSSPPPPLSPPPPAPSSSIIAHPLNNNHNNSNQLSQSIENPPKAIPTQKVSVVPSMSNNTNSSNNSNHNNMIMMTNTIKQRGVDGRIPLVRSHGNIDSASLLKYQNDEV